MNNNKRDRMTRDVADAIHARRRQGATWADIQAEFDVSSRTAVAALARFGLDHSPPLDPGARKAVMKAPETWTRPCLVCGAKERRARWLFRCKKCRLEAREQFNAPDYMYTRSFGLNTSKKRGGAWQD